MMNTIKPIALFLLVALSGCGYIDRLNNKAINNKIKAEEQQAIDFLKHNEVVIREVGGIKDVIPSLYQMKHREALPFRYIFSVYGVKTTTAVVNVSRSSGNVQFTLACLGNFTPWQDPSKDPYECKQ